MNKEEKIKFLLKHCQFVGNCKDCELHNQSLCKDKFIVSMDDAELDYLIAALQKKSDEIQQALRTEIKDSGNRREFSTGAVRDMAEGKGRMDLLPWNALIEVSRHCEKGAKKYGEHNVDRGIPTNSLCDSAARHLAKYFAGWEDEPHLIAAAWNLLWCIEMTMIHPELINTPWGKQNETGRHTDNE